MWIAWDRVAPPGASRTPELRRRDPLVQPQSINSWLARFGASWGRVGSVGRTRRDDADVRMTGREGLDQACVTVRQRVSRCAVRTERYPSEDFKRVNYVSHRGDLIRSTKCSQLNRFRN